MSTGGSKGMVKVSAVGSGAQTGGVDRWSGAKPRGSHPTRGIAGKASRSKRRRCAAVGMGEVLLIYWPGDREWFRAKVKVKAPGAMDDTVVVYDDGMEEAIPLVAYDWCRPDLSGGNRMLARPKGR